MPIKPSVSIGDVFKLNCGSIAEVIEYQYCHKIKIKTNTGYVGFTHASLLRNGKTTDWNYPTLADIGFIGFNPKTIKKYQLAGDIAYETWRKIIKRCYKENWFLDNPTYNNAIVCDEWFSFKNFKEWFDNNYVKDYHLDKDLKSFGLKVYSPKYCIFIPQEINKLFYQTNKENNTLGVKFNGSSYIALDKSFNNIYEAKNEYWNNKLKNVTEKINKYPQFKELLENYFEYYFNKHY